MNVGSQRESYRGIGYFSGVMTIDPYVKILPKILSRAVTRMQ